MVVFTVLQIPNVSTTTVQKIQTNIIIFELPCSESKNLNGYNVPQIVQRF